MNKFLAFRQLFILFLFASSFASPIASPAWAGDVLVLNTTGQPPLNTQELTGFMDLISSEAFKRIGITLNTVQLPAERGLKNSNAGIEDGEMSRVSGLEKKYTNLIQVPEKIMDWDFVAFSPLNITLENGWSDLAPYSLAYINGWKILEKNINFQGVIKVRNHQQLFDLLKKQRSDIVIYERWSGLLAKFNNNLTNISVLTPPLARKAMYIYLHKKHKELVTPLSKALLAMKNDGTYQKIFHQTLSGLEN